MSEDLSGGASLPALDACRAQAEHLAGARSRLLRLADVARRRRVLDLGCGWGLVTPELARRARGDVVALDRRLDAVRRVEGAALRVAGDARRLPFADGAFDLIFGQCVMTWVGADGSGRGDAPRSGRELVADEIRRVLAPGGACALLEPDHSGLMEDPPEVALRDVWLSALARAGADPSTGRRLPRLLAARGLDVVAAITDRPRAPDATRTALLDGLPLTPDERAAVEAARRAELALPIPPVVHLPFWMVVGEKRP